MKNVWGVVGLCLLSLSANATLISRAGGQAYYDDVLNITWLTDAGLAASNSFGVSVRTDGMTTWDTANLWIAAMNSAGYLGQNDWRLPAIRPLNGSSFDTNQTFNGTSDIGYNVSAPGTSYAGSTASELAHLYYNTLGNQGYCEPANSTATICAGGSYTNPLNRGPFSFQPATDYVWFGQESSSGTAWTFLFYEGGGYQRADWSKNFGFNPAVAWAVLDGDPLPAAVPIPATVWLLGTALAGLGGRRWLRRKIRS